MSDPGATVRIKVSPQVAVLLAKDTPRDRQIEAARGAVPLPPRDLLTLLLFFCHGSDAELRASALATTRRLPTALLVPLARDAESHPQLLGFIGQTHFHNLEVVTALLANPTLTETVLLFLAGRNDPALLQLLAAAPERLATLPALHAALLANPHLPPTLHAQLMNPSLCQETAPVAEAADEAAPEADSVAEEGGEDEVDAEAEVEEEEEEINLSKYQQALEMGVSEKIKMALTGDKEWRAIFLKDPNKLVHGAVLKNPRITEGEVLALAKNKASSDEMIRIILLNREWLKNYRIKSALVTHPKTPTATALRFIGILGEKELKSLSKSKGVSQVIVNAARRLYTEKLKKR